MKDEDRNQLELLRQRTTEAAEILRKSGHDELAANLCLNAGFACGLAHRLDRERQDIQDHIAACLV